MAWPFSERTLNRIERRIWALQQRIDEMAHTLDELMLAVSAETTVVDSVVVLVKELRDQIAAIPDMTPEMQAKVDSLFDAVTADASKLAGVVTVNTPSATVE